MVSGSACLALEDSGGGSAPPPTGPSRTTRWPTCWPSAEDPGEQPDRAPTWPRLGEVVVPTLVVEGSLDLPWAQAHGRQGAQMVPDGEAVVLDGVGHLPGLERPPDRRPRPGPARADGVVPSP